MQPSVSTLMDNARVSLPPLGKLLRRVALACAVVAAPSAGASAQTTLRAVLGGNLQVLDPIASTSYPSRTFGYLVYDTLISRDSTGSYKPQMLESFEVSADGMTYVFRLRAGMRWSSGGPVRAQDCVASLRRWGKKDGLGARMLEATESLTANDDLTFTLKLAKPFGLVLDALGKESSNVPFMMPERLASADPNVPLTEVDGSGPFLFKKDEFVPGSIAVFVKNPNYKPRSEPANGMAGGKVVKVDRVELKSITDTATQVSALVAGEIDYLQYTPFDLTPILKANKDIFIDRPGAAAQNMGFIRLNHAPPPLDNPKTRLAFQAAIDPTEIVAALGAQPEQVDTKCRSLFTCGGPYEAKSANAASFEPNMERAKALLREAGYKGEKLALLTVSGDNATSPANPVIVDQLRRAGFTVEVQEVELNTLFTRRVSKAPPDQGGWSAFVVFLAGVDTESPVTHLYVSNNCNPNYPGWSCDEKMRDLMTAFVAERDYQKRRELATQISDQAHINVPAVSWGEFAFASSWRTSLRGMVPGTATPVFWNVEKR